MFQTCNVVYLLDIIEAELNYSEIAPQAYI